MILIALAALLALQVLHRLMIEGLSLLPAGSKLPLLPPSLDAPLPRSRTLSVCLSCDAAPASSALCFASQRRFERSHREQAADPA